MKAPEKIYMPTELLSEDWTRHIEGQDIEYTRTDAFIEKACLWLSNIPIEDMTYKYNDFDTSEDWYKFIEDFKNYMKGE